MCVCVCVCVSQSNGDVGKLRPPGGSHSGGRKQLIPDLWLVLNHPWAAAVRSPKLAGTAEMTMPRARYDAQCMPGGSTVHSTHLV